MVRNHLFVMLLLLLSACAIPNKQLDNNQAFSHHQYNSADMEISWKSEKLESALHIDGTVTNVRDNYVYEALELEADLLDIQGKVIAKQTYSFTPIKFKGPESFKMTFPLVSGMQPDRIKFNYRYGIDEDRFSVKFESRL